MKIGIDIGGSHIAIGLVNDEGKIIEKIVNFYHLIIMVVLMQIILLLLWKKIRFLQKKLLNIIIYTLD